VTEVSCTRIRIKPGSVLRVREWAAHIKAHREEALATLVEEGVTVESVFLESSADGDFLIYLMRAASIEYAHKVGADSVAPIDAYHKKFMQEVRSEVQQLELLVDLERNGSA
jgi:hypothetical protein